MASFLSRKPVRRAITIAIVVVAVVLVVLEGLIAGGILVLSSKGPAPVTISSVFLKVQQGETATGNPWFLPAYVNYTSNDGYPIQVSPGGSWKVVWSFLSIDTVNHTIYTVTASSPFTIQGTQPTLQWKVPPADDDGNLAIMVTAPSTPGTTYSLTLTVNALTPS
ncbi:MAG: hypothetical protein ABSB97_08650 [Thermoplasmata archaeon]|jgi:hypothetical protein